MKGHNVGSGADYLQLAIDSWDNVLEGLRSGEIVLENESELRYFFFHHCLILMKEKAFEKPYSIFAENSLGTDEKYPSKCDLVLGEAIAIEFKYKNSINTDEANAVKDDILKLKRYLKDRKANFGVFLMIDQTGRYEQHISTFIKKNVSSNYYEWQAVKLPNKRDTLHALRVVLLSG